jgi:hypothetical protein
MLLLLRTYYLTDVVEVTTQAPNVIGSCLFALAFLVCEYVKR